MRIRTVAALVTAATVTAGASLSTLSARSQGPGAFQPGQPTGVNGAYLGQTPPGTTPVVFAPGIVSLDTSVEGWGTMSPDGKEFYFHAAGRTPGATVAEPPGRARFGPQPLAIMVTRLGPGGWTFPEQVAATAGYSARGPHVSLDNKRLYWEWLRAVPSGEADPLNLGTGIWASERTREGWSAPSYVGQAMAVTTSTSGDLFASDLSELDKGVERVARVVMQGGKFARFERLQGGFDRVLSDKVRNTAHPVVAPDGTYMLFDSGAGPARVCFRNADGSWGDAIDLSEHGLDPRMQVTSVSPDGKYVFLAKNGDIYWVSAQMVTALRPGPSGK